MAIGEFSFLLSNERAIGMKIAGLFEEFWPPAANPRGSIREFVAESGSADEARICRYLRSGDFVFAAMGMAEDVFGSGESIMGGSSVLTDGEWVWRSDLQFYVSKYHVELPHEFVDRIRSLQYSVPVVSVEDMSMLTDQIVEIRS
ncbi:hypothetical protein [Nocardia fluminea]|uniref:hypothetical protein n=1 Tax=Nocardia fluminea TaxID=134984 RepID=UPI003667CE04